MAENTDLQTQPRKPLTKAQAALLEVLRDPSSLKLNTSQICEKAGISRGTYYNAFEDKDFQAELEMSIQSYIKANEFKVLHNIFKKATDPNVNAHHWAMIAERMAGRLESEARKPAVVQVVFTNVQRPKITVDEKEQKALIELNDADAGE